jgi:hypothetical protein
MTIFNREERAGITLIAKDFMSQYWWHKKETAESQS